MNPHLSDRTFAEPWLKPAADRAVAGNNEAAAGVAGPGRPGGGPFSANKIQRKLFPLRRVAKERVATSRSHQCQPIPLMPTSS